MPLLGFALAGRGGNKNLITSLQRNIACRLRGIALVPAVLALIHCNWFVMFLGICVIKYLYIRT